MVFNKYDYIEPSTLNLNKINSTTYSSRNLKSKQAVLLPLPSNIQDTFTLRVQGNEFGLSGSEISKAASAFAGAGDISVENLGKSLTAALPQVDWNQIFNPNISEASRNIAFLGRRTIDQLVSGMGRSIDIGLGNAINPKLALHFDGMNLKQFDFRWALSPGDAGESDTIKDITDLIKRNSLPSYGSTIGLPRSLLNYPSTVDIFFLGIDQQYFVYFKTCMIQQLIFNYTPQGLAIVKGGKPALMTIDVNFLEMDIHTAEDYGGESTSNVSFGSSIPPGNQQISGQQ